MNPKYKTPEQVEFADLVARMGWRPVDVARELEYTPGWVSLVLSGKRNVTRRVLNTLRDVVKARLSQQGEIEELNRRFPPSEPLVIMDAERREVRSKLDGLADSNPAVYRSISVLIDGFTAQPRANSAEAVAQGEPSELDVAGVPRPPAAPAPKPATAAPSAHKRAPAAPARTRASAPPATPKPAPSAPEA